MSYIKFAQTYDKLMDKTLYDDWASFVTVNVPKNANILELACGSGDLASRLETSYNYIATDISSDMLVLANEKLQKTQLLELDMRDFSDIPKQDAVLCFADSLCYLNNSDEMLQTFQNVYHTLNNGGVFLFDVHSIYQMEHGYYDFQYHYVDDETLFIWNSYEDVEKYSVVHEISCTNRLENGLYERYDETHFERTYPLEEYIKMLENVGFSSVQTFADFGKSDIQTDTTRWFFVVRKDIC